MTQVTHSTFKAARRSWGVIPLLALLMFFAKTTLALAATNNTKPVVINDATSGAGTPVSTPVPADIARIRQRGELIVSMLSTDTPPFFFEKEGRLVGLEVDLARAIARELKVDIRFNREANSFNEVIDMVAQRRADLGISKLSRTLPRAQIVYFSQPYLTLNHALVLNRVAFARLASNEKLEDTVRQFKGTLGVIAKSSFTEFAKKHFPMAKVIEYPNWNAVLDAVNNGEVTGAYRDEFEIKRLLKNNPTAVLTLRTVTLKDLEDTLSIAIGVTDPTLLAFVNQVLSQQPDKLDIHKVLNALKEKP
ncbi:ABC transporter substrate-binding protein [Limnohabitans sp. Rim8]|jgi:ABC-type amino acid transport substrate-binding protein|uniref:substrate-binding periplasmic protein n=1 Tax=Limnohabitans sp. Rim8 TaxID=1100718 RepID=UPI0025D34E59|nr:ABC transporter substrate-binding protein [Limnohabitans sp. Rim8]